MKIKRKITLFLAIVMTFLAIAPKPDVSAVLNAPETVSSLGSTGIQRTDGDRGKIMGKKTNVKPIILEQGKAKKVQLDNKGEKEKLLYTLTREKLYYDTESETTYYKITYRFTIDGNVILERSWDDDLTDYWEEEGEWEWTLKESGQIIVTDVDTSDERKDIFIDLSGSDGKWNGDSFLDGDYFRETYRIQYEGGKIVVKEDLDKMIESLDLPKVVSGRWVCSLHGEAVMWPVQPRFKNGKWIYDRDAAEKMMYQITTTGDGTVKWAVSLEARNLEGLVGTITLKLKNNHLKLKSKTISGDVLDTGKSGAVDKKLTVYTSAGGKKAAYTVKKGDVLQFVSYKLIGNRVYLQVKNAKGSYGWISETQCKYLFVDGTWYT